MELLQHRPRAINTLAFLASLSFNNRNRPRHPWRLVGSRSSQRFVTRTAALHRHGFRRSLWSALLGFAGRSCFCALDGFTGSAGAFFSLVPSAALSSPFTCSGFGPLRALGVELSDSPVPGWPCSLPSSGILVFSSHWTAAPLAAMGGAKSQQQSQGNRSACLRF